MKISKSVFKKLVKECLVEILAEGVGASLHEAVQKPRHKMNESVLRVSNRVSHTENTQPSRMPDHIKNTIKEANSNPVLQSILMDTALNSVPKMAGHKENTMTQPMGAFEQAIVETPPEALFGADAASKWADLAFMTNKPKSQ